MVNKYSNAPAQLKNAQHCMQSDKGDVHYVVYKEENEQGSAILIKKLTESRRVEEIARMLSGDQPSETSPEMARELLNRK